jgi:hypothetical protein
MFGGVCAQRFSSLTTFTPHLCQQVGSNLATTTATHAFQTIKYLTVSWSYERGMTFRCTLYSLAATTTTTTAGATTTPPSPYPLHVSEKFVLVFIWTLQVTQLTENNSWCVSLHCVFKYIAYINKHIFMYTPQSGDQILVGARFSAPVQTGPGAHPASSTMGSGSFLGVKSSWGVMLTPHPLLELWSRKGRAKPLLPLWAVRPVQSLSACTKVHFTFYLCIHQSLVLHTSCVPQKMGVNKIW